MKVAFLVDYNIRTRIVIEVEENESIGCDAVQDKIAAASREKILAEPDAYIISDNIVEVEEDDEMPYDKEYDDFPSC